MTWSDTLRVRLAVPIGVTLLTATGWAAAPNGSATTPGPEPTGSASATPTPTPTPAPDVSASPTPDPAPEATPEPPAAPLEAPGDALVRSVAPAYVKVAYAPDVFVVDDTGHASYVSWDDYVGAGNPEVITVPEVPGTTYEKLPESPRVFAVLPNDTVVWINAAQWQAAGSPTPTVVPALTGSRLVRTRGAPNVYAIAPSAPTRVLTWQDYVALGQPPVEWVPAIPGSRFVKTPDAPTIWAIAPDGAVSALTWDDWSALGRPTPTMVPAPPGSRLVKTAGSPAVYAVLADGRTRLLTWADYVALGQPRIDVLAWDAVRYPLTEAELWASYRRGCPVGPASLVRVEIPHWDFDGRLRRGSIVVASAHATTVDGVLRSAFDAHFPLREVTPVEKYGGDDLRSMAADNTSAFNCRSVTGNPSRLSQHSYGNAVDVGPFENPYVTGGRVLPEGSATYTNRGVRRPGMIYAGDAIHGPFSRAGWLWGARWSSPDYQHFSSNGG